MQCATLIILVHQAKCNDDSWKTKFCENTNQNMRINTCFVQCLSIAVRLRYETNKSISLLVYEFSVSFYSLPVLTPEQRNMKSIRLS